MVIAFKLGQAADLHDRVADGQLLVGGVASARAVAAAVVEPVVAVGGHAQLT